MASPAISIVAQPTPTLAPHDESWLNTLRDDLALLEAEAWDELHDPIRSTHPGARWRVLDLLTRAADRRRQIAALRAQS